MRIAFRLIRALYFILWIACAVAYPQPPPRRGARPAAATLGRGFVSSRVSVNGTSLHYVRGGSKVIPNSGHCVADEQPPAAAELIERHARL